MKTVQLQQNNHSKTLELFHRKHKKSDHLASVTNELDYHAAIKVVKAKDSITISFLPQPLMFSSLLQQPVVPLVSHRAVYLWQRHKLCACSSASQGQTTVQCWTASPLEPLCSWSEEDESQPSYSVYVSYSKPMWQTPPLGNQRVTFRLLFGLLSHPPPGGRQGLWLTVLSLLEASCVVYLYVQCVVFEFHAFEAGLQTLRQKLHLSVIVDTVCVFISSIWWQWGGLEEHLWAGCDGLVPGSFLVTAYCHVDTNKWRYYCTWLNHITSSGWWGSNMPAACWMSKRAKLG